MGAVVNLRFAGSHPEPVAFAAKRASGVSARTESVANTNLSVPVLCHMISVSRPFSEMSVGGIEVYEKSLPVSCKSRREKVGTLLPKWMSASCISSPWAVAISATLVSTTPGFIE